MEKPIRIAIMGTGFVRRLHLEGLRRVGSAVEVRGLATTASPRLTSSVPRANLSAR